MKVGIWNTDKIDAKDWKEVERIEAEELDGCSLSSVIFLEEGTTEEDVASIINAVYNETDVNLMYEILQPVSKDEFRKSLGLSYGGNCDTLYQDYCDLFQERPN